jgi:predicted nucleic acid-binding protein
MGMTVLFLLDTNAVSDLVRENAQIAARLSALSANDSAVICTIVLGEILFGLEQMPVGRRRSAMEAQVQKYVPSIPCRAVPESAAAHYAQVKQSCRSRGVPLDEADLWIAATALALDATLVTRDSDFGNVDGLRTEDWRR